MEIKAIYVAINGFNNGISPEGKMKEMEEKIRSLPDEEYHLLLEAYSPGATIRKVAEKRGCSNEEVVKNISDIMHNLK